MTQSGHPAAQARSRRRERSIRITASGLAGEVYRLVVGSWGIASFENDAARDWFLLVEEAPDPGAVMTSAIDDVVSAARVSRGRRVLRGDRCRGALRVLRRSAAGPSAGQRGRVGAGEPSRAARRRGRARGSSRHPRARGERAARPLGRLRRLFSVAGRSGPSPIATETVQRQEPTLRISLTKYRGRRPVILGFARSSARGAFRHRHASRPERCSWGEQKSSPTSVALPRWTNLSSQLELRSETPPFSNERQRDVGGCLPDLS